MVGASSLIGLWRLVSSHFPFVVQPAQPWLTGIAKDGACIDNSQYGVLAGVGFTLTFALATLFAGRLTDIFDKRCVARGSRPRPRCAPEVFARPSGAAAAWVGGCSFGFGGDIPAVRAGVEGNGTGTPGCSLC